MIRRLDAFLMLHGRRALAWVGGFRRRHTRIVGVRMVGKVGTIRIEGERWVR